MLAATIERVTVIRRPFQASIRVLTWRFVMLIIAIIGAAFVVTFYHHVRRRTDFIDGKYIQRVSMHIYIYTDNKNYLYY